jgi:hypothetical protein
MRNSTFVKLDDNRIVTIQELRVKDVRQLLSGFTDLDKIDVAQLLGNRFAEISSLLEPFIGFPENETIEDLSGSELQEVINGFKQVNIPFLIMAGIATAMPSIPKPEQQHLTEPVAD